MESDASKDVEMNEILVEREDAVKKVSEAEDVAVESRGLPLKEVRLLRPQARRHRRRRERIRPPALILRPPSPPKRRQARRWRHRRLGEQPPIRTTQESLPEEPCRSIHGFCQTSQRTSFRARNTLHRQLVLAIPIQSRLSARVYTRSHAPRVPHTWRICSRYHRNLARCKRS